MLNKWLIFSSCLLASLITYGVMKHVTKDQPTQASIQESVIAADQGDHDDLERLKTKKRIAEKIKNAARMEVMLLKFDSLQHWNDPSDVNLDTKRIPVAPYFDSAEVLKTVEVSEDKLQPLLHELSKHMAAPYDPIVHYCHYPIHGATIYDTEDKIIYSGSFCWYCTNWGFAFPDGETEWLGTSDKMKCLFIEIMPIPEEEIERFKKTYKSTPTD